MVRLVAIPDPSASLQSQSLSRLVIVDAFDDLDGGRS